MRIGWLYKNYDDDCAIEFSKDEPKYAYWKQQIAYMEVIE
jgi:hypothetical protein